MAGITISVSSEVMQSRFGNLQDPLCSYIESRAEVYEQELDLYKEVFSEVDSKHYGEAYSGETELEDLLPVGENGAYPNSDFQEGYSKTIRNMTFKGQFSISREAIDDDVLGTLKKKPEKLLKSYYRGKARLMARMIGEALQGNASFTANGFPFSTVGADGVCVFSGSHAPKVSGGNQCNVYSDSFSSSALFAAIQKMQNLKDDNGNTLNINPNAILISNKNASLKQSVLEVVSSLQKPGTANNDNNVLFGNLKVLCSPYLNDYLGALSAPWVLLDTSYIEDNDCNILQNRINLELKSIISHVNDANVWQAYARYGVGFVDFRGMLACGVTGASSM